MSLIIKSFKGTSRCKPVRDWGRNGSDLKHSISEIEGFPSDELVLTCNGRLVEDEDALQANGVYYAALTLKGGKGGFGSMLRMLGAQIEKTTNHEACRDLSGRRMRDVNNEKKLAEWVKNKADAEAEREQRRREKLERMARDPKHFFVDPNYDQQKQDVSESLQEAVTKGMEASASNGASTSGVTSTVKRKGAVSDNSNTKKRCMWMGVEDDSDEDNDDDNDEERPQYPASSSSPTSQVTQPAEEDSPTSSSQLEERDQERIDMDTKQTEQGSDTKLETCVQEQAGSTSSGDETGEQHTTLEENGPVDLDEYTTEADLETLGLEKLKTALMDRGLKCGGTLKQRAERLFSIKGLSSEQINPALKAKPAKGKKKGKK